MMAETPEEYRAARHVASRVYRVTNLAVRASCRTGASPTPYDRADKIVTDALEREWADDDSLDQMADF